MKTLNLTFEDKDFMIMQELKNKSNLSWETFILTKLIGKR